MTNWDRREHSRNADEPRHEADDREERPSEEAQQTTDPLHDPNFMDQSQGPNHPIDDRGRKKDAP